MCDFTSYIIYVLHLKKFAHRTHCFLGWDSSNLSPVHSSTHYSDAGDDSAGFNGMTASPSPPTPAVTTPTLPPPPPRSSPPPLRSPTPPLCSPTPKRSAPPPPPPTPPSPKSTRSFPSPRKRGSQKRSTPEWPKSLVPPPKKAALAKKLRHQRNYLIKRVKMR